MLGQEDEKKWYIVYTKSRSEKKLAKLLEKFKIINYLPLLNIRKKWSDRFKFVETAVFPSYIFVKIQYFQEKNKILILPGVMHFVTINHEPQTVDEANINGIKEMIAKYPDTINLIKEKELVLGKKIKVKYGAFKGINGIIIKINKNKSRLVIQIPVGNISAEINTEDLGLGEIDV